MSHLINKLYLDSVDPQDQAILRVVRAATAGFVQLNFALLQSHFEQHPNFKIEAHIQYNAENQRIEVYTVPTLNDPEIGEN